MTRWMVLKQDLSGNVQQVRLPEQRVLGGAWGAPMEHLSSCGHGGGRSPV